ncbi:hypothetical protein IAT38_004067 [Cryptococcus sp. DSM 104549]
MKYAYTHVDGFFSPSTWAEDVKGAFGLCSATGDWGVFEARIKELNAECPKGESIKVLYVARHGQGEHNLNKDKYGGFINDVHVQEVYQILDPSLTQLGRDQAAATGTAIQREVARGMPLPEKWFVSPLERAGETCGLEWGWAFGKAEEKKEGDVVDKGSGVPAVVIETLRAHIHAHQCDKRSPISKVSKLFPSFDYSPITSEEDERWLPRSVRDRETKDEAEARCGMAMAECLDLCEGATYISVTGHVLALQSLYAVLGVPPRQLGVGEMNVLVLRVKQVDEEE